MIVTDEVIFPSAGLDSFWVVVMAISSSCLPQVTPPATRPCFLRRGCASNPLKSTSMTLMVCATCWAPPSPSHTHPSPHVQWTLLRCLKQPLTHPPLWHLMHSQEFSQDVVFFQLHNLHFTMQFDPHGSLQCLYNICIVCRFGQKSVARSSKHPYI